MGKVSFFSALVVLSSLAVSAIALGQAVPAADDIYIVIFEEAPLATYSGNLAGLAATAPQVRGEQRLNPRSNASRAYLDFLAQRHGAYLTAMQQKIGRAPVVIFDYRAAANGVAIRVTPDEAAMPRRGRRWSPPVAAPRDSAALHRPDSPG